MGNATNSSLGVSVGLILCGLLVLGFPKYTEIIGGAIWLFYIPGLLLLLVGILGGCVELFKKV